MLCISKAIFEKLTLETQEFFKEDSLKSIPAHTPRIKLLCKALILSVHHSQETIRSAYTPTKIWATRCSELWQWQRVSEWYRKYGQDEIVNEKRHILA